MNKTVRSTTLTAILSATSILVMAASTVQAGVVAYAGLGGEKLFIEAAPKLAKDTYLIKFEGPESKWAGKVIRATREKGAGKERYGFDYDLELSSGVQKRRYNLVAEINGTLKNGSLVKQVELYFQEGDKDGLKMTYDEALSKASQSLGLAEEHKKHPFKPDVD